LKESESKLNSILSSIDDLVFVFDQEGRFIFTQNPTSEQLYTAPDEFIGKKLSEVMPPHLNKIFFDAFDTVEKGGVAEYDYWLDIDGKTMWFSANHSPRFIDGEFVGSVAVVRDITERKQAEEALRASEEKFREMAELLPETVYECDAQETVTFANKAAFEMFGLTRDDFDKGVNAQQFIAPDDRNNVGDDIKKILRGIERGPFEYIAQRIDGSKFPVISHSSPIIRDGETVGLRGIVVDITERKQAEEEKEKLRVQLTQAQKMESVGRLAGGVAHDFNNMLTVILGCTKMAMEQVDPSQPLHADLTEIRTAAKRSEDLTRKLLAFARKQTITPRVLDLNETVGGMLKMLRRLIGEDIDFAWMPGAEVWPVKVDPSQIDQILANLCVNVRDAIEGVGKVTIETRNATFDEAYCADHPGYVPGEYVLLAVSDDGCGMDKETLDKLFEPFFTTKEMGNTGLGLATVYGIVKQNNGFINVYSEPGQGTNLKIYLHRHAAKATEMQEECPAESAKQGYETILLVEDEPAILKMVTRMLELHGYTVLAASTPGEAICLTEAHPGEIHLLLTDVVLPEMNGQDLAENLLSIDPNLKRMFMSGYPVHVIAHHGVLDEGVWFLQKPFAMQDLVAKVREALDGE